MTYVDPQSDLVKAVLVKKATQLATDGLEQRLDEAEVHGLSRDEALAIIEPNYRGAARARRIRPGLSAALRGPRSGD